MAAGVTDHVRTLAELVGLLEAAEQTPDDAWPVPQDTRPPFLSRWHSWSGNRNLKVSHHP